MDPCGVRVTHSLTCFLACLLTHIWYIHICFQLWEDCLEAREIPPQKQIHGFWGIQWPHHHFLTVSALHTMASWSSSQRPGRFWGIIGQDRSGFKVRPVPCCDPMLGENRWWITGWRFETSGELSIVLEESMEEYTSNQWKQNRKKMSTCNRLDWESRGSWPTLPKNFIGTAVTIRIFLIELRITLCKFLMMGNFPEVFSFDGVVWNYTCFV